MSKADQSVAHTKEYIKVVIPRDDRLKGRSVLVNIVDTAKWHIVGEVTIASPAATTPIAAPLAPPTTSADPSSMARVAAQLVQLAAGLCALLSVCWLLVS